MSVGRITLTDVSINLRIAVFNPGRVTAVIDRMDLWLTCKGERTARMNIGALTIQPGETKIADTVVDVPFSSLGMSLGGEDSAKPPCRIQGKAFVNLPSGEVSIPVTIGKD